MASSFVAGHSAIPMSLDGDLLLPPGWSPFVCQHPQLAQVAPQHHWSHATLAWASVHWEEALISHIVDEVM